MIFPKRKIICFPNAIVRSKIMICPRTLIICFENMISVFLVRSIQRKLFLCFENMTLYSKNMFFVIKMMLDSGAGGGGTSIRTPPRGRAPEESGGPWAQIVSLEKGTVLLWRSRSACRLRAPHTLVPLARGPHSSRVTALVNSS